MEENKNYLSEYEYDSLWMSYRYCIGRHTIAAHMHAADIAMYSVDRLRQTQKLHTAADINMEIYDQMRFSFFRIENFRPDIDFPLDIFFEFVNQENITSYDELKKYKYVTADRNMETGIWEYRRILKPENDDTNQYLSRMDFEDLSIWQTLVHLLRDDLHKPVKLKNQETGEVTETMYYEPYALVFRSHDDDSTEPKIIRYERYKRPVDSTNLNIQTRINEDCIVE